LVDFPEGDEVDLSSEVFKNMEILRVLIVKFNACIFRGPTFLPDELRVLDWPNCPLESFPSNFSGKKLVILRIPGSLLKGLKRVEVRLLFFGKLCHHPIVLMPVCFGLNILDIETFSNLMNFIFVLWIFVNRDLN
jgi:hypothetical protein